MPTCKEPLFAQPSFRSPLLLASTPTYNSAPCKMCIAAAAAFTAAIVASSALSTIHILGFHVLPTNVLAARIHPLNTASPVLRRTSRMDLQKWAHGQPASGLAGPNKDMIKALSLSPLLTTFATAGMILGVTYAMFRIASNKLLWQLHPWKAAPSIVPKQLTMLAVDTAQPVIASHEDVPHKSLGYTLLRKEYVKEINSEVAWYRHDHTGAEVLSVANSDENKVFSTIFRTTPKDSTGVPHILEHSVLCGSRKYPVKEPFVELLKSSLHTYLNAYTYPDKTMYPVASCNLKDFYNLVDVYLDAVFHPNITEETLMQEGWHLELESKDAPLTYKGVVFNEMKGVYSQPESILWKICQEALFPDPAVTYSVDSGGDPRKIPDLTFDQYVNFHKDYYHPSNARFFFYGDDPLEQRFHILNDYLKDFAYRPNINSTVPFQSKFSEPRRVVDVYPAGEEGDSEDKTIFTINWVLHWEPLNPVDDLILNLFADMLMGNNASPLRRALNESELGESVVGGLDDTLQQRTFSCGLKNVSSESVDEVERIIMETLEKLSKEGFTADTIEASLNSTEFSLREMNTGSYPRGITLMLTSLRDWLHGHDPIAPLAFDDPLAAIKLRLAAGEDIFRPLIRRYLLDNPHCVVLELRPDSGYGKVQAKEEADRLQQIKETMTSEELDQVMMKQQALQAKQAKQDPPEALQCIPSLKLEDVAPTNTPVPAIIETMQNTTIVHTTLETNEILYLDLAFDLHAIPQDLLPYMPLFAESLVELGTHKEDFVTLLQRIQRKVGGLNQYVMVSPMPMHDSVKDVSMDSNLAQPTAGSSEGAYLMVRGKGTAKQLPDLVSILNDVLLDTNFNNQQKFKQMVLEAKAEHEEGVVGEGHNVAVGRVAGMDHSSGWLNEQIGGLSYLFFLRKLEEEVEKDWPFVLEKLEQIRQSIITRHGLTVGVTANTGLMDQFRPTLNEFLGLIPDTVSEHETWTGRLAPCYEAISVPTQVNYVAKGANLYANGYKFHGSAYVINKYLGMTWLWDRVRVMGGAYGGWSNFDRLSGHFSYASYRDPNILKTIEAFDGTPEFLEKLELNEDALTKAIIGAIGEFDPYHLPDAKGYGRLVRHLLGVREEDRQRTREEILSTTPAHFKEFAAVLRKVRDTGSVVVVGSAAGLDEATAQSNTQWTRIQAV